MDILRIDSVITAFIRPKEGANVGLIQTPHGMILIDTASSPADIQSLLEAAGISIKEVCQVINTHFHEDHTWGNQLFDCPILAHRSCQGLMQAALESDWSPAELRSNLRDLEKRDPLAARDFRTVLDGLVIKIPNEAFDDRFVGELGGVKYEAIHYGGHTPDLSVVWLPERKILYASDLVFQGRYPYIFDSDVPTWISALDRTLEYPADVIIPGHGVSCGEAEMLELRNYLQGTWERVKDHIRAGRSLEETCADPAFPIFPGEKYDRLHQANIRYMYNQQL